MSSAGISKILEYVHSKIKQNDFIYVRGVVEVPLGEMDLKSEGMACHSRTSKQHLGDPGNVEGSKPCKGWELFMVKIRNPEDRILCGVVNTTKKFTFRTDHPWLRPSVDCQRSDPKFRDKGVLALFAAHFL